MMGDSGIYIIRNLKSKKVYIGSAVDLDRRRKEHYMCLRGKRHCNPHLQHSWDKYSADAFEFKVLIRCDIDDLLHYEQRAMDIYKRAVGWDMMYNINPTAGSPLGVKHTAKTRARQSAAMKGKSNGRLGTKHSVATKAKMSARAKRMSPEHKAKLSRAQRGKPVSLEARAKISAANKGRKLSPETRARMVAGQKARRIREKAKQ